MKKRTVASFIGIFLLTLGGVSAARASSRIIAPSPFAPQSIDPTIASDTPFVPIMPSIPATTVTGNVYDANDSFDPGTARILLALAGAFIIIGGFILQERALRKTLTRLLPQYYSNASNARTSYQEERRYTRSERTGVDPSLGQAQQTV